MVEAISVASILIPTRPVSLLLALVVAIVVSGILAGRSGLDAKWASAVAESSALVGLVGARIVFAALNSDVYREAPWTAFYLWQPGYYPWAGVVLGLAYAIWRLRRRADGQHQAYLKVLATGYGLGVSLLLGLFLVLSLAQRPGVLRPGDVVPDFSMETLEGVKVQFANPPGRAVILNFWATWCPPCRREMPLLDSVQKEYSSRDLMIVGVNLSEPRERVADYIAKVGVEYPIWVDAEQETAGSVSSRELFQRFGGVGLPTTIFIDRAGRIRDIYVGELNRAKLQGSAEELIASKKLIDRVQ